MTPASSSKRFTNDRQEPVEAISVEGYKSILDKQRLEIRPFTILAGANSSGKSSMMQPLLLLKQTLEATFDPGALLLNGANVRLTSADQVLSRTSSRIAERFGIEFELKSGKLGLRFSRGSKVGLELEEMSHTEASGEQQIFRQGMPSEAIDKMIPGELRELTKRMAQETKTEWAITRDRCFYSLVLRTLEGTKPRTLIAGVRPTVPVEAHISRLIHVPGLRGNPERTYPTTAVESTYPGLFQEYVASIVTSWKMKRDERLAQLGASLEELGLTWKVDTLLINDTQVELRVGRLPHAQVGGGRDLVSIADVGFGVSQTLPVVVALLAAEPGQIIYLEQPEIHLHPLAQVKLPQIISRAVSRGVIVIAETHSSLFLLGVQTMVARGMVEPDKVKLHWFKRNPKDGLTRVSSADLDERGAYGEWPEDFGDVKLEAESLYLNTVARMGRKSS